MRLTFPSADKPLSWKKTKILVLASSKQQRCVAGKTYEKERKLNPGIPSRQPDSYSRLLEGSHETGHARQQAHSTDKGYRGFPTFDNLSSLVFLESLVLLNHCCRCACVCAGHSS